MADKAVVGLVEGTSRLYERGADFGPHWESTSDVSYAGWVCGGLAIIRTPALRSAVVSLWLCPRSLMTTTAQRRY
jgi:hypothetical protein